MATTGPTRTWPATLRLGLIGGVGAVLVGLIGMVERFSVQEIVYGVVSLGHTLYLGALVFTAYGAAGRLQRDDAPAWRVAGAGTLAGAAAAAVVAAFVLLGETVNLRWMFVNATSELYHLLTFTEGPAVAARAGIPGLVALAAIVGATAGAAHLLGRRLVRSLGVALAATLVVALLSALLRTVLRDLRLGGVFAGWLLAPEGLAAGGALALFLAVAGLHALWARQAPLLEAALGRQPPARRRAVRLALWAAAGLVLVALPQVLGSYLSEVLNQVGLFILLGLGLNIVVGFAGMLDLGYVAFFAIGAYTVAVLTSPEKIGTLTFWQALPVAVVVAVLAGVVLGIPVLRMRGDYLAIVTLGFGEIIQLLARSEWLRPLLGGAQGVAAIPPISLPAFGIEISGPDKPQKLFYLILVACVLAAFVAVRLKDSRVGRAWMALREDEDVAQAMGIDLVSTKLLAFATGAALSGVSGAIFATKLGTIYSDSFDLLISINILALIIVGGMGSIPGVIVGALALIGLPELLREFAEFRLLVYGALLVVMMLKRPEGLVPSTIVRRELHADEPPPVAAVERA